MKPKIQEHLVHQYLLGDLPDQEQLALEQEYFTSPETFERIWEIENELVDRYVRGTLSRQERALFEQNYLASPVHRKRVAFAKTLLQTVDLEVESRTNQVVPISRQATLSASLGGKFWQWATIAAAVVLLGITVLLVSERARLHRQIDQLKAEASSQQQRTQELEQEIIAQRDHSDKLASEIARLHEEPPSGEGSAQPSQNEAHSVLSVVLSPILMRGESERQQIRLTKETAVVLQMRVERSDAREYQVALRTVDGVKAWSTASVKARSSAKGRSTVTVSIPASKLDTNEYILTLSGTNDANQTEEVSRYFFRVSKE